MAVLIYYYAFLLSTWSIQLANGFMWIWFDDSVRFSPAISVSSYTEKSESVYICLSYIRVPCFILGLRVYSIQMWILIKWAHNIQVDLVELNSIDILTINGLATRSNYIVLRLFVLWKSGCMVYILNCKFAFTFLYWALYAKLACYLVIVIFYTLYEQLLMFVVLSKPHWNTQIKRQNRYGVFFQPLHNNPPIYIYADVRFRQLQSLEIS